MKKIVLCLICIGIGTLTYMLLDLFFIPPAINYYKYELDCRSDTHTVRGIAKARDMFEAFGLANETSIEANCPLKYVELFTGNRLEY